MYRPLLRWAAIAVIAPLVAACGGAMPRATLPGGSGEFSPQSAGAVTTAPIGAPVGIRSIVHVPLRNEAELEALVQQQSQQGSSQYHRFLTPAQFAQRYAPSASTLQSTAAALKAMGFATHVTTQSIIADAPQATVEKAFGVKLRQTMSNGRSVLAADRAVTLPQALRSVSASVVVSPKYVLHTDSVRIPTPANRYAAWGYYYFDDLKQAYSYPAYQAADGAGRTVGIVMSNAPLQSDVNLYFENENWTAITGKAAPKFELENVDGGAPFDPNYSAEVSLDVQESLGSAPGVRDIVYDTPDTSFGSIYDAYTQAIDENRADIISASLGLGELFFTPPYWGDDTGIPLVKQTFHDLFLQGTSQGITFVASSGDLGAKQCPSTDSNYDLLSPMLYCTSWPADDPLVTGVGGTNLETTALPPPNSATYPYPYALTSKYVAENADYDPLQYDIEYTGGPAFTGEVWGSGGGVSIFFPAPLYQALVPNVIRSGRNSPDIAMHMGGCPEGAVLPCNPDRSADLIFLGGQLAGLIGTSCSAPEFAGLLAVTEQHLGGTRLGNANYYIYALAAVSGDTIFHHSGIRGNNGGYETANGYDRVIGVGTPYADLFSGVVGPVAGNPQTSTNP
jgi:subtilase family serine protease